MNPLSQAQKLPRLRGLSMPELIISVSIIGILAAIVAPAFPDLAAATRDVIARDRVEMLNQAVERLVTARGPIPFGEQAGGGPSLEMMIVLTMQMRDPLVPGSPLLPVNYRPALSSQPSDYRARFLGGRFQLIFPGDPGTGLRIQIDGSDLGAPVVIPPDFKPYGF